MLSADVSGRLQKLTRSADVSLSNKERWNALKYAFAHIVERNSRQAYTAKAALVENGAIPILCSIVRGDSHEPTPVVLERNINIWDKKGPESRYQFTLRSEAVLCLRRMIEIGNGERSAGLRRVEQILNMGALAALVPHLWSPNCASGYASACLKELAQYEEYRQAIVDSGALDGLCFLIRSPEALSSYRNASECLHLVSCSVVDRFEEVGILDACVEAALRSSSGEKVILTSALCAANITAGRDDMSLSNRMDDLYQNVQLGAHICRCLQSSLPQRSSQRVNYMSIKWTQVDILKSILHLVASDIGRKQLVSTWGVKDTLSDKNLNITDLLYLVFVSAREQLLSENIEIVLEIILHLSFSPESASLLLASKEMMTLLRDISDGSSITKNDLDDAEEERDEDEDNSNKVVARNILYVLNGKLSAPTSGADAVADISTEDAESEEEYVKVDKEDAEEKGKKKRKSKPSNVKSTPSASAVPPAGETSNPYIMISYSWAHQKVVLDLCCRLKQAGLSYWLDVEQMHGNINDRMAEAIEGCSVVLIVSSSKYKLSANCRMEAEYSFSSKKPLVPVLAESKYVADGWLGLLLSGKLYYDISSEAKISNNIGPLLDTLRSFTGGGRKDGVIPAASTDPGAMSATGASTQAFAPPAPVVKDTSSTSFPPSSSSPDTVKDTNSSPQQFTAERLSEILHNFQQNIENSFAVQLLPIVTSVGSIESRLTRIEGQIEVIQSDKKPI